MTESSEDRTGAETGPDGVDGVDGAETHADGVDGVDGGDSVDGERTLVTAPVAEPTAAEPPDAAPPKPIAQPHSDGPAVAILLAVAAVIGAVLAGRATMVSGDASNAWQQAVRQEVKRAAATVEDVRFTYSSEAVTAWRATEARVRGEELRTEAAKQTGGVQSALVAEAEVQEQLADAFVGGLEIASNDGFALPGGGYDVPRRLAEVRSEKPDLVALDPEATQAQGDAAAQRALLEIGAAVPIGITFLFGALAQGFPRRRRVLLGLGVVALVVGVGAAIAVELMP